MTTWVAYPINANGEVCWNIKPFTFTLNPGEAPPHVISAFFSAINDVFKAHGGYGLKFIAKEENAALLQD